MPLLPLHKALAPKFSLLAQPPMKIITTSGPLTPQASSPKGPAGKQLLKLSKMDEIHSSGFMPTFSNALIMRRHCIIPPNNSEGKYQVSLANQHESHDNGHDTINSYQGEDIVKAGQAPISFTFRAEMIKSWTSNPSDAID